MLKGMKDSLKSVFMQVCQVKESHLKTYSKSSFKANQQRAQINGPNENQI